MTKPYRDEMIEKLDILDNLIVWSSHTLTSLRYERDAKAAESLDLIIKAIKDPEVLETLESIRNWAMIPF